MLNDRTNQDAAECGRNIQAKIDAEVANVPNLDLDELDELAGDDNHNSLTRDAAVRELIRRDAESPLPAKSQRTTEARQSALNARTLCDALATGGGRLWHHGEPIELPKLNAAARKDYRDACTVIWQTVDAWR